MRLAFLQRLFRGLAPVGACSVFVLAWYLNPGYEMAGFAVADAAAPANDAVTPIYTSSFTSSDLTEFVHASSVAALPDGDLVSVWFAGSREGAGDVHIHGARYKASAAEWGDEFLIATRETTRLGTRKPIRKLGNPVIALAPDNRLWLFYVSVSVGGWAGSAINAMVSDDLGYTWSTPRQLVTTPFLNISTLVRAAPVFHADGSIGLPVYHEFLGKFAEYLYLDADGRVVDKFRISRGNHSLQPSVVALDERHGVAMLRWAGEEHGRVLVSHTHDAGRSWSEPVPTDPWNPNSSLAAVAASTGLLVALNDLQDGRFRLRLYGTDALTANWHPVIDLDRSPDPEGDPLALEDYRQIIGEKFRSASGARRQSLLDEFLENLDHRVCRPDGCDFEYEYPFFTRGPDGRYHLVYSWNNVFIKHVSFNDAWLEQQL